MEKDMNIDFYFDFISPYSYLAATRIPAFEAENQVEFNWIPVNLPKLIKLSGNTPPSMIRNKALYSMRDLKRWANHLNVPFRLIKPGSFDSRPALRIASALNAEERAEFCLAVFDGLWSGSVDPGKEGWLNNLAKMKGLPAAWLSQSVDDLDSNTETALKAGAFGVPTFIVHGKGRPEMFFGLDHMDLIFQFTQGRNEMKGKVL